MSLFHYYYFFASFRGVVGSSTVVSAASPTITSTYVHNHTMKEKDK